MSERCTCESADDAGDPEVGPDPDPYIAVLDEDCPIHGRPLGRAFSEAVRILEDA